MTRKPLSPEAKAAAIERVHEAMRKACEQMERRKQQARDVMDEELEEHLKDMRPEEIEAPAGVLAQLNEQPREA